MIDTQREQVSSVAEDVNSDDFVDHVLYNELFFAMPWVSISGKVWMDYDSGTPAGMYYFCNPDKDEFYAVIHLLSATDISHVQATDDETRLYIVYDRLIPTSQIGETPNGRVLAEYDISMLKLSETEAQADHELHEE